MRKPANGTQLRSLFITRQIAHSAIARRKGFLHLKTTGPQTSPSGTTESSKEQAASRILLDQQAHRGKAEERGRGGWQPVDPGRGAQAGVSQLLEAEA